MSQRSLFDPPEPDVCRTHHGGNPESEAANSSIHEHKSAIREQILDLLRETPMGLTCEALETSTGLKHQTVSARVTELLKSGLIRRTGRRAETSSGRLAAVLELTPGKES